jgi:Mu transposase, C-terminal domain
VAERRVASRQALIAYRGNRYAVPPELAGAQVEVVRQLDTDLIDILTTTSTGSAVTIARHRLVADGTGAVVRDAGHVIALQTAAMAAASTSNGGRPHRRKERIPPGPDAIAAAKVLANALRSNGILTPGSGPDGPKDTGDDATTVIDLAAYERAANGRNTLT